MATHFRRRTSRLPKKWFEPDFGDPVSNKSRKPWMVDQSSDVSTNEKRDDDGLVIQLEKQSSTSEEKLIPPLNKLFAREGYLNGRRDQLTSTIEKHEEWLRRTEDELTETRRLIAKAKSDNA